MLVKQWKALRRVHTGLSRPSRLQKIVLEKTVLEGAAGFRSSDAVHAMVT